MTNYQYIVDLFTAVLSSSKSIEGRFHVGNRYALQEANYDQLGEVLQGLTYDKKYPMVVMAPPSSSAKFTGARAGWEQFRLILYFCKTSFYGDGALISDYTKTSQHAIHQDWHDMKRCAINFIRALVNVQRNQIPHVFSVPPNDHLVTPFSGVGADRVSGVHIHFDFNLYTGCDVEDYDEYPKIINIPLDSHPEHKM